MTTKDEILQLVGKYFQERKNTEFIPGETYLPPAKAYFNAREVKALVSASLDMKWVDGDIVKQFEKDMAKYLGVRYAIMTNSGSSANLLAMSALMSPLLKSRQLQPGDEVITVACGFPTTVNPIMQNGLIPVFVDVNIGNYNTTPFLVENAITEKTRAIFIAHTLGNPYDIDEIKELAKLHNIWIIEDACFVAGTLVTTKRGDIPIEEVLVGDLVLTRQGYKKVTVSKMTGKKQVITKLGLTATPDHPIITKDGIKRLDALSAYDIIYLWKKHTSTITEQSIQDTQTQRGDIYGSTIGQEVERIENLFIHRFGEMSLVKSLQGFISTIKMATHSIMKSPILNVYQGKPMPSTIGILINLFKQRPMKTLHELEMLQRFGMEVQKGGYSIQKLLRKHGKTNLLIQQFVKFVEKSTKPISPQGLKTALVPVKTEAEVYNLTVEDAHEFFANGILVHNCDAIGAELDGKKVGTFGNLGTTSFYPAHIMAVGEGGMVFTDSPMLDLIVRSYRDWGRSCFCLPGCDNTCGHRFTQNESTLGELPEGYDHKYVYSHIGYNLKSTDLQASIGIEQLRKLPEFLEDRKANWEYLRHQFQERGLDKYFILPTQLARSKPAWFGFLLTLKMGVKFERTELLQFLEDNKIGSRLLFGGNLTKQPAYIGKNWRIADEESGLPHSDIVMARTFWIGVHPSLTRNMLDYILDKFVEFVANYE